ncbi:MAG: NAD(P)-binding domain-containing protein, partial [Acetobacteraceae bacterium]|nr:NAD(P)-binding domain-containing protein [Acetobacteraceae bacterium]
MRIGIIGAGALGTALGRRLTAKGHEVTLSFSRDPVKLREAATALGARSASVAEAAAWAEVIALATPWAATELALRQAGDLSRRIVWDCTNPLKPDFSGLVIGTDTSGGEVVARWATGSCVVKAIPPFADQLMAGEARINGRPLAVFVCGDDPGACAMVARLVADLGAEPVEAGPLAAARAAEPFGLLMVQLAYRQ